MAAALLEGPFTIGDTWVFTLTLERDDAAVNVTGATITSSIWRNADRTEVLADRSVTLTTPASGIVTLTLAAATTAGLVPGLYYGDVKVVYSGGTIEHFGPYQFLARAAHT